MYLVLGQDHGDTYTVSVQYMQRSWGVYATQTPMPRQEGGGKAHAIPAKLVGDLSFGSQQLRNGDMGLIGRGKGCKMIRQWAVLGLPIVAIRRQTFTYYSTKRVFSPVNNNDKLFLPPGAYFTPCWRYMAMPSALLDTGKLASHLSVLQPQGIVCLPKLR